MQICKSLIRKGAILLILAVCLCCIGACDYRPLGKNACRFTLNDPTTEYIDWRIYPDNSTSSDAAKLKYIDTNSFVCRDKLQPGKYIIKMRRKKGMGFTRRSVVVEEGKWDYILDNETVSATDESALGSYSISAVVKGAGSNQFVNVLLLGQPTLMKEVQLSDNHLKLSIPANLSKYKPCIIIPDVDAKLWMAPQYMPNTGNYDLGEITPAK